MATNQKVLSSLKITTFRVPIALTLAVSLIHKYPANLFVFRQVKDVTLDNVRITWADDAEKAWQQTK